MRAGLEELYAAAGVEDRLIAPLARYAELVLEANRAFNLTGAKTAAGLVPHVIDSLRVAPFVTGPLVDVGSGAGLPAIPIAIATGVPIAMIEAAGKKARFLSNAIDALHLRGEVISQRAEVAGHDQRLRERFSCGTARAVSTAPTVAELLLPFIQPGGVAIVQRGAIEARERIALTDAALMLGAGVEAELAQAGDCRIFLVRKVAPTPPRFPRRTGVPEKRPLCLGSGSDARR